MRIFCQRYSGNNTAKGLGWQLAAVMFLFLPLVTADRALALPAPPAAQARAADAATPRVQAIRLGGNSEATRVVFDLSAVAQPRLFFLSSPERLVIDFKNLAGGDFPVDKARGLVGGLRHGLFDPETYRIVLDLARPVTLARQFPLAAGGKRGPRYVVDLQPASAEAFRGAIADTRKAAQTAQASQPGKAPERMVARAPRSKRVIVLDPGHGGVDPGALGVLGVHEKEITLKVSRAIVDALNASGRYDARLTRDRDIYIAHRQRYGVAHKVGADLFISVHADSIANSNVRGGTIYTLSETASDREAARLAAKENKSDIIAGLDLDTTDTVVSGILIDLAQRETLNESVAFAQILLPSMRRQVRMHERGHRFANLLVLKSIDVPSILLEAGYLTNRSDARLLNSRDGQRKIARGVLAGMDAYFARREVQAR